MTTENRFDTIEAAQAAAVEHEAKTGEKVIAYKSGYLFEPYVVMRMPQVGDDVSMSFNGDSYPCGKIVKISKTFYRITAENGTVFTRTAPARWKEGGKKGAFTLIQGIHSERNPHF